PVPRLRHRVLFARTQPGARAVARRRRRACRLHLPAESGRLPADPRRHRRQEPFAPQGTLGLAPGRAGRASRLIVVSNRLPFVFKRAKGGRWSAQPGSGGLVTALLPVLRDRGGLWIGWPGANAPARSLAAADAGYRLVGVPLATAEVRGFYQGFSNEVIWPLFHDLPSLCNFDPAYWRTYGEVNRKYAKAVHRRAKPGDFVWVHDYHLMSLAAGLRALGTRSRLAFFCHIPFPAPDVYMKLPWRAPLLDALLEYDLIGFQTARDRRNFLACAHALGRDARPERTGHFPISIDYNAFMRRAAAGDVAAKARELHLLLPRRKLVLGIDRLDYTKGIALRLRA